MSSKANMVPKAKESVQIQKARKKIEEQLKKAEKKMNPEALSTMSRLIKEQLHRQQPGRIDLKKRQVTTVGDLKNKGSKAESKFITKFMHQIKHDQFPQEKDLEGRIRTISENK